MRGERLVSILQQTFTTNILSSRLAAAGGSEDARGELPYETDGDARRKFWI